MMMLQQFFLFFGAFFGFLGVSAGAFGAHLLKTKLPPPLFEIFEIAVRYQMYHALVLVLLVSLFTVFPSFWLTLAGWFFISGILIFSGSLYLLVFTAIRTFGAITPLGGVLLLLGWLCLIISAFSKMSQA